MTAAVNFLPDTPQKIQDTPKAAETKENQDGLRPLQSIHNVTSEAKKIGLLSVGGLFTWERRILESGCGGR